MRYILLILLLVSTHSFSQIQIDLGSVKADKCFFCDSSGFFPAIDSVQSICKSKNLLEIRLGAVYNPFFTFNLIILGYNGTDWTATQYESLNLGKVAKYSLLPLQEFDTIFLELKRSNVFLLPNQSEIHSEIEALCGVNYYMTYKVGDKFRSYHFDNPKIYSNNHKNVQHFQDYNRIAEIFTTWFKKE